MAEHISDDNLERYALGEVEEEEEPATLEEHLLWCQGCLERVQETENYVNTIRVALLHVDGP